MQIAIMLSQGKSIGVENDFNLIEAGKRALLYPAYEPVFIEEESPGSAGDTIGIKYASAFVQANWKIDIILGHEVFNGVYI
jgi:hypothetical protein